MIMCGDFQQVLPVIPRASKAQTVEACLNKSYIWDHNVEVITLHQNMRVQQMMQDGNV
jgi:ATP-dependent DNA helicase PIF1